MNKRRYKDCFLNKEEWYIKKMEMINKKIGMYNNRFMNNPKWKKLFYTIFINSDIIKQCEISDFFGYQVIELKLNKNIKEVNEYLFDDFIDEYLTDAEYPISYREIEYLEFRKNKPEWIGRAVLKTEKLQNTDIIKEIISKIGQFHWEENENYIRIYGYK
jgi:hypothetical protein